MSSSEKNELKRSVDSTAGAGTSDKIEGKTQHIVGEVKQAIGDATGNERLHSEGVADEAEGKTKSMVGEVKEGVASVVDRVKDAVDGGHRR